MKLLSKRFADHIIDQAGRGMIPKGMIQNVSKGEMIFTDVNDNEKGPLKTSKLSLKT